MAIVQIIQNMTDKASLYIPRLHWIGRLVFSRWAARVVHPERSRSSLATAKAGAIAASGVSLSG